jgi:predicted aspartyl protease
MNVNGRTRQIMLDTGCSVSLIGEHAIDHPEHLTSEMVRLVTMGGNTICSNKSVILGSVMYGDRQLGPVKAHVVSFLPLNVDVVMGLDILQYHAWV